MPSNPNVAGGATHHTGAREAAHAVGDLDNFGDDAPNGNGAPPPVAAQPGPGAPPGTSLPQAVAKAQDKAKSDNVVSSDPGATHHVKLAVTHPKVLGGTAGGAVIGLLVAGPPGAVVGAIIGGVTERYSIAGGAEGGGPISTVWGKLTGAVKNALGR